MTVARTAPTAKTAVAAKKTAAPAKKATPTATKRAAKPPVVEDDEPDLLAGLDDPDAGVEDDEEIDLLSDLSEDNGEPWTPSTDEDVPRGIQGRVTFIGTVDKDEKFGGGQAPMIEITTKAGDVWSIRGYHTVLDNKITRMLENGMVVGDTVALKYLGPQTPKNGGKDYENYAGQFQAKK